MQMFEGCDFVSYHNSVINFSAWSIGIVLWLPCSGNKRAEAAAVAASSGGSSAEVVVLDPMGYYSLLGLSPTVEVSSQCMGC